MSVVEVFLSYRASPNTLQNLMEFGSSPVGTNLIRIRWSRYVMMPLHFARVFSPPVLFYTCCRARRMFPLLFLRNVYLLSRSKEFDSEFSPVDSSSLCVESYCTAVSSRALSLRYSRIITLYTSTVLYYIIDMSRFLCYQHIFFQLSHALALASLSIEALYLVRVCRLSLLYICRYLSLEFCSHRADLYVGHLNLSIWLLFPLSTLVLRGLK